MQRGEFRRACAAAKKVHTEVWPFPADDEATAEPLSQMLPVLIIPLEEIQLPSFHHLWYPQKP